MLVFNMVQMLPFNPLNISFKNALFKILKMLHQLSNQLFILHQLIKILINLDLNLINYMHILYQLL